VDGFVSEKVIVYQGSDKDVLKKLSSLSDFCFQLTNKGNADPDRNFAYGLAMQQWILALDDDEYLPDDTKQFIAQTLNTQADCVWFNFNNTVDDVSIKHILGDDPHPRLWRNAEPPIVNWPSQAHTFPNIGSPKQVFTKNEIVHARSFAEIMARHETRKLSLDPGNAKKEEQFIEEVKKTLDKR